MSSTPTEPSEALVAIWSKLELLKQQAGPAAGLAEPSGPPATLEQLAARREWLAARQAIQGEAIDAGVRELALELAGLRRRCQLRLELEAGPGNRRAVLQSVHDPELLTLGPGQGLAVLVRDGQICLADVAQLCVGVRGEPRAGVPLVLADCEGAEPRPAVSWKVLQDGRLAPVGAQHLVVAHCQLSGLLMLVDSEDSGPRFMQLQASSLAEASADNRVQIWEEIIQIENELGSIGAIEGESAAYIPRIGKKHDLYVWDRWLQPGRRTLKEYAPAAAMVCVAPHWMATTQVMRLVVKAREQHPQLLAELDSNKGFERSLAEVIKAAYNIDKIERQRDIVAGKPVADLVRKCYRAMEKWKKPFFSLGLHLLSRGDCMLAQSTLVEVCDHALHCPQVQVKAFEPVLANALRATGADSQAEEPNYESPDSALSQLYHCFEDYLDEHKERAFASGFIEPARAYLAVAKDAPKWMEENVDTHSANWWIALLGSALAIQLPVPSAIWDDFGRPLVDFWAGLSPAASAAFLEPDNFGKSWQSVLKDRSGVVAKVVAHGQFPEGNRDVRTAKYFANEAVNPVGKSGRWREQNAVYLERFAAFFARDFFVKRCFETLNSELKPEHAGFRKNFELLFETYCQEFQLEGCDSYVDYCYQDDMYCELDIDRTAALFEWLGLIRPAADASVLQASACVLEQSVGPIISSEEIQTGEVALVELAALSGLEYDELLFMDSFLAIWGKTAIGNDAQFRAEVFEKWQCFEMAHHRDRILLVAKLVLDDKRWTDCLGTLTFVHQDHLWDTAGCIFRLYGLVAEGLVTVSENAYQLLHAAMDAIIAPLEVDDKAQRLNISGPHLAGLWMQALAPLVCASFNSLPVVTTQKAVKRLGQAMVKWWNQDPNQQVLQQFEQHMVVDYMLTTQALVWGRPAEDVVWQTFMKRPLPEDSDNASQATFQENLATMESMGFSAEAAGEALRMSHGSLDAALEYLVTVQGVYKPVDSQDHMMSALVDQLVVMGFDETASRQALKATNYQIDAALQQLCV